MRTSIRTCADAIVQRYTHACICMRTCTYICVCARACLHMHMHSSRAHTYMHTHTHTHTSRRGDEQAPHTDSGAYNEKRHLVHVVVLIDVGPARENKDFPHARSARGRWLNPKQAYIQSFLHGSGPRGNCRCGWTGKAHDRCGQ